MNTKNKIGWTMLILCVIGFFSFAVHLGGWWESITALGVVVGVISILVLITYLITSD